MRKTDWITLDYLEFFCQQNHLVIGCKRGEEEVWISPLGPHPSSLTSKEVAENPYQGDDKSAHAPGEAHHQCRYGTGGFRNQSLCHDHIDWIREEKKCSCQGTQDY